MQSGDSLTAVRSTSAGTVGHAQMDSTARSSAQGRNTVAHSRGARPTERRQGDGGTRREQRPSATWSWVPARLLPAASLTLLMVWQITALLADGRTAFTDLSWLVVAGFARAILYAAFLSILIVAVLLRERTCDRDGRFLIRGAAVTASFLLVMLGALAPAGPLLLQVPAPIAGAAALVTLVGALLALAAALELGTNFSFGPQSRRLVVTGPYRLVRHPMYLAELMMTSGAVMVTMHLTLVIGICAVIFLQIVRITAEEQLLTRTMPAYGTYVKSTRCRLIPAVW